MVAQRTPSARAMQVARTFLTRILRHAMRYSLGSAARVLPRWAVFVCCFGARGTVMKSMYSPFCPPGVLPH